MDPRHRVALLRAARNAIAAHLGLASNSTDAIETAGPLTRAAGAFVSLHKGTQLRGCVGTMFAERPLAELVRHMAVAAASGDPRFLPVVVDELGELCIEVSVLERRRLARPDEVVVGQHGVLVSRGAIRGVLLPQVAVEHRWSAPEFLAHTCRKAGLGADSWRDPETRIEIFEAEVFGEP